MLSMNVIRFIVTPGVFIAGYLLGRREGIRIGRREGIRKSFSEFRKAIQGVKGIE
jgi:hypothetical protein